MKMCLLPVRLLPLNTKIFYSLLLCVFFPRFKMKHSPSCQACKKPFISDSRHQDRQRFCSRPACQRARRRANQNLRRSRAKGILPLPKTTLLAPQGQLAAEAAMKPHEAALAQFHPVIIGLVSQLVDSTSLEDILVFMRRCAARGQDILYPPGANTPSKVPISGGKLRFRQPRSREAA